jgi:hypothetical protein
MGTGLAARRLAVPPSPAHPAALRDGILDPIWGIGLHIERGMGSRNHTVALFFTPRINPNCDRLQVPCRGLDIETDAENTPFPERSSFAPFNPASGPGWSSRHQRLLVAIDDGYKHGGKPLYIHSLRGFPPERNQAREAPGSSYGLPRPDGSAPFKRPF